MNKALHVIETNSIVDGYAVADKIARLESCEIQELIVTGPKSFLVLATAEKSLPVICGSSARHTKISNFSQALIELYFSMNAASNVVNLLIVESENLGAGFLLTNELLSKKLVEGIELQVLKGSPASLSLLAKVDAENIPALRGLLNSASQVKWQVLENLHGQVGRLFDLEPS